MKPPYFHKQGGEYLYYDNTTVVRLYIAMYLRTK